MVTGRWVAGPPSTPVRARGSNKLTVTPVSTPTRWGQPKPGNVEIEFDNAGIEIHMMAVVGLKPGVTKKQLKKAAERDQSPSRSSSSKAGFNVTGTRTSHRTRSTSTITQPPGWALRPVVLRPGTRRVAPRRARHGQGLRREGARSRRSSLRPTASSPHAHATRDHVADNGLPKTAGSRSRTRHRRPATSRSPGCNADARRSSRPTPTSRSSSSRAVAAWRADRHPRRVASAVVPPGETALLRGRPDIRAATSS